MAIFVIFGKISQLKFQTHINKQFRHLISGTKHLCLKVMIQRKLATAFEKTLNEVLVSEGKVTLPLLSDFNDFFQEQWQFL